ncbi:MAG: hypothetical protein FGM39_06830 [Phycisphaerales bacterium]|nr:hypothetical protein [Phycisphaerales bacterium]
MRDLVRIRACVLASALAAGAGCASPPETVMSPAPAPPVAMEPRPSVAAEPSVAAAPLARTGTDVPPALRPVPDAPQVRARMRAARARGLAWALANQRPDGSFGTFESPRAREVYLDTQSSHRAFHTATTALVCWSLIAPAVDDPAAAAALERGLGWLERQGEIGRASGNTFYSVWAHTYLIELAASVVRSPHLAPHHAAWREVMEREVAVARREQSAEGGWAYYDFNHVGQNPSGNESTSFNTAAMIEALLDAREAGAALPEGVLADAMTCLERMRIPTGAFAYGTYAQLGVAADYNKVSGASGRLQVCNLSLFRMGATGIDGESLLRGVEQLRTHHHYIEIARGRVMPHEAYYRNSGYYYFFGHYYCARVLQVAPAGARRDLLVRWLAEQMAIDQNPDGSWFDYPLYGYGFAYATGYAMRTLELLVPLIEAQCAAGDPAAPGGAPRP